MSPQLFIRLVFFSLAIVFTSCNGQNKTDAEIKKTEPQGTAEEAPIAQYVVEVFEDSKGNLWFGTINKGAAKYDGKSLTYLTTKDGLIGNIVTSFAEDKEGNIWFGTHSGLSKYDGKIFTGFTTANGMVNNTVSELLIDRNGTLWIGTFGGVSRLNGTTFSTFTLPIPDVPLLPYQATMNWVTEIIEDKQGNIWISRDGYGVCKYNGRSFTQYTRTDGLISNNIQEILADRNGNTWFGSRVVERDNPDSTGRTGEGGLTRFNGKTFTHFPEIKGLSKNEVYSLYEDRKGNIWIGANRVGVYRYDGKDFTLFSETDRADLMPYGYGIQSIFEDSKGNIWFGLSGGLFRLIGNSIKHVPQTGPWN